LLRRLDEQKKASDFEGGDFGALMRATRKEATPSSTDWDRPAGEMKIDPASMVIQADSIPSDRREVRQALSPNEKLESGWPRDKYWKLLRNLLNRRDESKLDLEK